ncbi:ATP-binding protein [Actinomadura harenae]|uniref:NTPase n=1 Tax=Actinomadura harenae TaxID=2483351 RepID=A0A3M2LX19_9ACTN|nr:NB-ARC domain-containing protein [Actinomadura harenae]RMI41103.1 NTPase [Actinomadura harenae]
MTHADGPPHERPVNEFSGDVAGPVIQVGELSGTVNMRAPAREPVRPRQLPATRTLVNRTRTLEELDRFRPDPDGPDGPGGAVVLSGPPGIGKTTVALNWAHSRQHDFPDGQLYADLRGHAPVGPALPADVLGGFLRALGVPPARIPVELGERAALYRSMSADRRVLVVLDDAFSAAQVTPLLPASSGSLALVTSRWRLAGLLVRGARGVRVEPFEDAAAMELLALMVGADRVDREHTHAVRLAELCAGLPLALTVAAARLASRPAWTVEGIVEALEEERRRLAVLAAQDLQDGVTVEAALELSRQALPEPAQYLYALLGLYPGGAFDAHVAAALAAVPVDDAALALETLADANLLDEVPSGRYRFHELTRLHARQTALESIAPEERAAAMERATAWCLRTALAASGAIAPYRRLREPGEAAGVPGALEFATSAEALDWLDAEFTGLHAVASMAAEAGLYEACWLLVDALWPLFVHRGHRTDRLGFEELGLAAARSAGDAEAEAKMLSRTGLTRRVLGDLDGAERDFLAARALWEELGNRQRVGGISRRLGILDADRRRWDPAVRRYGDAIAVYRELGETRRAARTLADLGGVLVDARRAHEAVRVLTEARDALSGVRDPNSMARTILFLARAKAGIGARDEAAPLFAEALARMREIGSGAGTASVLRAYAEFEVDGGAPVTAVRLLDEARTILTGLGLPAGAVERRLADLADGPPR